MSGGDNMDNNIENNKEKQEISKGMKIIIAIIVLTILFVICGIFIKSTASREEKIVEYLQKQYDTEFEVVELTYSGEKILFNEISCDGSTFCPEIRDENTIVYKYNVKDKSDDFIFEVIYEDGKLSDEIKSSYFVTKKGDETLDDLAKYIIDMIGDENSIYEYYNSEDRYQEKQSVYEMDGHIFIKVNKNLADELNKNYIEDKLRVISSYIKSITKKEDDVKLTVIVDFDDGRQLWFYYMNVLPLIREHNGELVYHSGDAEVESYSPYEYMERLEKFNG